MGKIICANFRKYESGIAFAFSLISYACYILSLSVPFYVYLAFPSTGRWEFRGIDLFSNYYFSFLFPASVANLLGILSLLFLLTRCFKSAIVLSGIAIVLSSIEIFGPKSTCLRVGYYLWVASFGVQFAGAIVCFAIRIASERYKIAGVPKT